MPRLSVFACQQHRRDLLEFPDRMQHPNGALGITALTIVCQPSDLPEVKDWLRALHGQQGVEDAERVFTLDTGRGVWRVLSREVFGQVFGMDAGAQDLDKGPKVLGIDISVKDLAPVAQIISAAGLEASVGPGAITLAGHDRFGGVALRFVVAA
jgi:hypothetical protein